MRKRSLLFAVLLFFGESLLGMANPVRLYTRYDRTADPACRQFVANSLPEVVYPGASSFLLSPHSQRYLTGMLARTAEGRHYLAIAPYRYKHESLLEALETSSDMGEIEPFRVVWLGELILGNAHHTKEMGQVLAANETAGLAKKFMAQGLTEHENRVAHLQSLEKLHPGFFSQNPVYQTFQESEADSRLHLLPGLDTFLRQMREKFARREITDDADNYRHYIGNQFTIIAIQVEHLIESTKNQPDFARQNLLTHYIRSLNDFERESLKIYLGWFENDNLFEGPALRLETFLARIESGTFLEMRQWQLVNELFSRLQAFAENDAGRVSILGF